MEFYALIVEAKNSSIGDNNLAGRIGLTGKCKSNTKEIFTSHASCADFQLKLWHPLYHAFTV